MGAEHTAFHHLFKHFKANAPAFKTLSEVKSLARLLEKVIGPHSHTEDELFIEPLEHGFDQIGHKETFHHEHELIEEMFVRIQKAGALKDARKGLLDVIAAARKHFEKEERVVFPMAERILKAKTLSTLGHEWMERHAASLK